MTEKALAGIVAEAKDRWDIVDALVIHRVGELKPLAQIVLVVVTGAHRLALPERRGPGAAAPDELRAQAVHVAGFARQFEHLPGYAHILAQPGKVKNPDAHWKSSE